MPSRLLAAMFAIASLPALAAAQPVQTIHRFAQPDGSPLGGLVEAADGSLYGTTSLGGEGGAIYRIAAGGGPLTIVARFDNGRYPDGALVQAADGRLYGTTRVGGVDDRGTVFRFDPATSRIETLHAFAGAQEGGLPSGPLHLDADGYVYGTTESLGSVYQLDPVTGRLRTLHVFAMFGPMGERPVGGVVRAADGFFYGLVGQGPGPSRGGIFRLDASTGAATLLQPFDTEEGPWYPAGGLTPTADGWLYGVSSSGGPTVGGTIFRFAPAGGVFEVVHGFTTDGRSPASRLVEGPDGSLYGTTGGSPPTIAPTVFRLRRLPGGGHAFSTVRTLDPAIEGRGPLAGLMRSSDGWIYGATESGGPAGGGTIFRVDALDRNGAGNPPIVAVVHAFDARGPGWAPVAPVRASDRFLYGMTRAGGAGSRGDVYRLDPTTGARTILGAVPPPTNDPSQGSSASGFVDAPDGALYGTVVGGTQAFIVRVTPSSGAVATVLTIPVVAYNGGLTAGLIRVGNQLYALVDTVNGLVLNRFEPTSATLTPVGAGAPVVSPSGVLSLGLAAGTDGSIYLSIATMAIRYFPLGVMYQSQLVRIDPATGVGTVLIQDSTGIGTGPPAQGPDGSVAYTGLDVGGVVRLMFVDPSTGARRPGCAVTGYTPPFSPVAAADGSVLFYAFRTGTSAAVLFRCPAGATTATALHEWPTTAPITVPLRAASDGMVYGATAGGSFGGGTIFRVAAVGTTPIFDADGDGLADGWEEQYGLSTSSTTGADGPGGDPDGDGVTNADEQTAGTHPRGTFVRYLAEGASNAFFTTRIALVNDGLTPARVLLRFQTDATTTVPLSLIVPPTSRRTVDAATVAGLTGASFSTVVEADARVTVDRTMSWGAGGYGSHTETAVAAPSATWYFAEGSTSGDFSLFYLLQNPQATPVTATIRYLRPLNQSPVERQYLLPAFSRTTIPVDADAALASTDVSAVVIATAPIIAERAMYFSRPGQPFAAGHDSAGVTAPALEWFLAEGATGPFFDLFLLLANPNPTAATVSVDYLLSGGGVQTKSYTVGPNARVTIWVDDEQFPNGSGQRLLANAPVSMAVRSTNAVPIVVERTMWWPGPETTADFWYEAHNSPGSTAATMHWAVGDGEVAGPDFAETYLLIANPGATPGRALVRLYFENGNTTGRFYDLPASSRTSVPVSLVFPEAAENRTLGATVESVGASPVPIVVERASYASPGGVTWSSGGNALATPIP